MTEYRCSQNPLLDLVGQFPFLPTAESLVSFLAAFQRAIFVGTLFI